MGNSLLRNKNNHPIQCNSNSHLTNSDTQNVDKLIVLIGILRLENEKLKHDLNNKIIANQTLESQLSKYVTLSRNLEERIAIENEFWNICDLKDFVKHDHNEFINNYYINLPKK